MQTTIGIGYIGKFELCLSFAEKHMAKLGFLPDYLPSKEKLCFINEYGEEIFLNLIPAGKESWLIILP